MHPVDLYARVSRKFVREKTITACHEAPSQMGRGEAAKCPESRRKPIQTPLPSLSQRQRCVCASGLRSFGRGQGILPSADRPRFRIPAQRFLSLLCGIYEPAGWEAGDRNVANALAFVNCGKWCWTLIGYREKRHEIGKSVRPTCTPKFFMNHRESRSARRGNASQARNPASRFRIWFSCKHGKTEEKQRTNRCSRYPFTVAFI